ncbi:MAG: c-type cytochrome [Gemmatimonadaceae bacterium]
MRSYVVTLATVAVATSVSAQAPGIFPPDSLVHVQVFPKSTPVIQVIGAMRNFAGGLGVRWQYCHVGEEGTPLAQFDFASDEKRTKHVARQMMRMVQEINRRLDTIPGRTGAGIEVTCATCHRGVSRPIPLNILIANATIAAGADSAIRAYRALRQRYYGRDAYDFTEFSLNGAALRVARANRHDDALALLRLNEELHPASSGTHVVRGNIRLLRGDTTAAVASFREAVRRDSTNMDARGRLRDLGQRP